MSAPPVITNRHILLHDTMNKNSAKVVYSLVCCYNTEKNNQNYYKF